MSLDVRIIVTDAAPLITLAAARSLDYLLYADRPVLIPDAVFHEATAASDKLGAQEILDWYRSHIDQVRIEPTGVFQREMTLVSLSGQRIARDLGERAALEVVRQTHFLNDPDDRALLLSDDRDAGRLVIVDPQKIILLTTWEYLRELEGEQRIQSADAVMEAARAVGRHPPTHDLWSGYDPEIRDDVKAVLRRSEGPKQ